MDQSDLSEPIEPGDPRSRDGPRRLISKRELAVLLFVVLGIPGCYVGMDAGGLGGFTLPGPFGLLSLLVFVGALVLLVLSIGWLASGTGPGRAKGLGLAVLIMATVYLGGGLGRSLRMQAFHDLAERSQPLVEAIERYSADHGSPPTALTRLVPDYLDEVPGTGMPAYPEYEYDTTSDLGDPWVLSVFCPLAGAINFDRFFYAPRFAYEPGHRPELSGSLEQVGAWMYLHE